MIDALKLGLVGYGKIARSEHRPAIASTAGIRLVAVADPHHRAQDIPSYASLEDMILGEANIDAVALCQPPQARFAAARTAILAGKHVLLEKPPASTLAEVAILKDLAAVRGVSLFAAWHSRWSGAVDDFRVWCGRHPVSRMSIDWREDVRRWHPNQPWIWESGGFGVFDPGINALSILTEVVPERFRVLEAELEIPVDCSTPIAARLSLESASGVPVAATFDWRQTGEQTWKITAEGDAGSYVFDQSGSDADETPLASEYPALYRRFVDLVRRGESEVDTTPLELVAAAFLIGRRVAAPALEH